MITGSSSDAPVTTLDHHPPHKAQSFNVSVLSMPLCGSQSWALTKTLANRIDNFNSRIIQNMKWYRHVASTSLRQCTHHGSMSLLNPCAPPRIKLKIKCISLNKIWHKAFVRCPGPNCLLFYLLLTPPPGHNWSKYHMRGCITSDGPVDVQPTMWYLDQSWAGAGIRGSLNHCIWGL